MSPSCFSLLPSSHLCFSFLASFSLSFLSFICLFFPIFFALLPLPPSLCYYNVFVPDSFDVIKGEHEQSGDGIEGDPTLQTTPTSQLTSQATLTSTPLSQATPSQLMSQATPTTAPMSQGTPTGQSMSQATSTSQLVSETPPTSRPAKRIHSKKFREWATYIHMYVHSQLKLSPWDRRKCPD